MTRYTCSVAVESIALWGLWRFVVSADLRVSHTAFQIKAAKTLLVAITVISNRTGSGSQAGNVSTVFNVTRKLHRLVYFKKVKAFKKFYVFRFFFFLLLLAVCS